MLRYIAPYFEITLLAEDDIITNSGGLEDVGQEGGINQDGWKVDDSTEFEW